MVLGRCRGACVPVRFTFQIFILCLSIAGAAVLTVGIAACLLGHVAVTMLFYRQYVRSCPTLLLLNGVVAHRGVDLTRLCEGCATGWESENASYFKVVVKVFLYELTIPCFWSDILLTCGCLSHL